MKKLLLLITTLCTFCAAYSQNFTAKTIEGVNMNFKVISNEEKTVQVGWEQNNMNPSINRNTSGKITVPGSVSYNGQDYKVTKIGYNAFYGCSGITSIDVPDCINSIGFNAFIGTAWFDNQPDGLIYVGSVAYKYKGEMPNNTSIIIKEGTTCISGLAFMDCQGLKSIEIPNSVTSIGQQAFLGCRYLTSIKIPDGVKKLEYGVFDNCLSLASIEIPNSITSAEKDVFNGTPWLNNQPDGLIYVGKVAYLYKGDMPNNTTIEIKDGTTYISPQSFRDCTGLTTISIPNSVTTIGTNAFSGCTRLVSIDIPNSVDNLGDAVFEGCATLEYANLPDELTSIGERLFSNCTSLKHCLIPNGVTMIDISAFMNCNKLESVFIPKSVNSIQSYAFFGCSNLSSVTIEDGDSELSFEKERNGWFLHTFENSHIKKLYVGRTLYHYPLNSSAFKECSIDSIIIGANIVSSDSYRQSYSFFDDCDCTYLEVKKHVSSISGKFSNFESLSTIKVEEGNTTYDSRDNCNAIIRSSDNALILGCKTTVIPNSVTQIGKAAFSGCKGLTSIEVPNTVTSIGSSAFENCSELTSLSIGNSVQFIDAYAFANCENLKDVYCYIMPSTFATDIFSGTNLSKATLYVPSLYLESFKLVSPWKEFGSIKTLPKYRIIYSIDGQEYETIEIEVGLNIPNISTPQKEGHSFSGWTALPETMPAHDVTVTGSFTINKYKLTYKVDDEEYKSYDVEYGSAITPEEAPIKEGFTFSGWSLIPETMPANDVTITGSFTMIDDIQDINADEGGYRIYTLDGKPVEALQKGANIIRHSNGSTQKVFVK